MFFVTLLAFITSTLFLAMFSGEYLQIGFREEPEDRAVDVCLLVGLACMFVVSAHDLWSMLSVVNPA